MSERRTQNDRVLAILRDAGAFYTSAQQITEQTGITRVAARIYDLKNDYGVGIESTFVNREQGKSYRLTQVERAYPTPPRPEPEEFKGTLFDAPPAPASHYKDAA